MAVYLIVDTNVHNPEAYEEYKAKAGALVEKHGGKYLVRGGAHTVLEGGWEPTRMVVLEFPSKEQFEAFYHGEEYQAVIGLRTANAHCTAVMVEGL